MAFKKIKCIVSALLITIFMFSGLSALSAAEAEFKLSAAHEIDLTNFGISGKLLSSKPAVIILADFEYQGSNNENTLGRLVKIIFEVGTLLQIEPGRIGLADHAYGINQENIDAHGIELNEKMIGKRVTAKLDGIPYEIEENLVFDIEVIPVDYDYRKQLPIEVVYNGSLLDFPRPPIERNGFLFYPLEDVFQVFCGGYALDEDTGVISGELNGNIVEVPINGLSYWVNGIMLNVSEDLKPFVENDIAYVYLDYIIDGLGLDVEWNEETRIIIVGLTPY